MRGLGCSQITVVYNEETLIGTETMFGCRNVIY